MFRHTHLTLAAVSLLAVVTLSTQAANAETNAALLRHGPWCGTPQVMPTVAQSPNTPYSAAARTVWLNRGGGTYVGSPNTNAATNAVSSGIFGNRTFTIAPMSNQFDWNALVTCVKVHYKPYNVRFVETKPTSGNYVQAVVGGTGDEIGQGQGQGLLGIAAADNFCGVTEAGIAFSFAEAHVNIGRQNDELCATVAHEIGHVLSLEHEILGQDTMSYVTIVESNTKSFVNAESTCGTGPRQTNACTCPTTSTGKTNSAQRLLSALGARPTETVAPTITLDSPKGGAAVGPSFTVTAIAKDNMAMESVALFINGQERGTDETAEPGDKFSINAVNLPEGEHEIIMQATDTSGNIARTAPIKVTVAKQVTGGSCLGNNDCKGNLCADDGTQKFCTEACTVENDTCPGGFDCVAVGTSFACYFSADDGSGTCGCQSGSGGGSAAMLGAFFIGAILMRKRRTA